MASGPGHTGDHHSPSLRSRRRSGRSNSACSCPPSESACTTSGQAGSGDPAAGEDGGSADDDASHCAAAAAAWAAAAWMSAGEVDAGRGSSCAWPGKLRCAARPLMASAATSWARAAISAVGNVPNQMRDFFRGSRISDTHFPQLRRRTPRYDGCLKPLLRVVAPDAAWALLLPLAAALPSVLQQLLRSSPWPLLVPVLLLASSTSWLFGEEALLRFVVGLGFLGSSSGLPLMREEEEVEEEEEEEVVGAWLASDSMAALEDDARGRRDEVECAVFLL
jgi:hypothetical protein